MRFKKTFYIVIGFIALILGSVGAILPILPTVPFFMIATFAFAKSSKRLHTWFTSTNLYKKNLETYVAGKGMTLGTKCRIMATVTVLMGFGFAMMMLKGLFIPCILLIGVWGFHIFYFVFAVKTMTEKE